MINKLFKKPSFSLFNNYEFINELKNKINEVIDAVNNTPEPPEPYFPVGYATAEQDTGMTWIDGTAIYKKTYEINDLSLIGTASADGITITDGATEKMNVIKFEGIAFEESEAMKRIFFCGDGGHSTNTAIWVNQDYDTGEGIYDVKLYGNNLTYSAYSCYVTLYYTKGLS